MSLYLKYRPQDFSSVVGQNHIVNTLKNAIKHESLTHAYLFSGPRGTGKTSLARILAKSINCTNLINAFEPCNDCDNCKAVLDGRMMDLIEIDGASNRKIEEIRELREKIVFTPNQGRAKIYIIDEVHMLTNEAFNALLKTLEEPPSYAYFILATTELHKIPATIVSRCQQFNFKRISDEDIFNRLKFIAKEENIVAEDDALHLISKLAEGGLRDAIGIFEQMTIDSSIIYQEVLNSMGLSDAMLIDAFIDSLLSKNIKNGIDILNKINDNGQDLSQFTKELLFHLRNKMLEYIKDENVLDRIIKIIDIFLDAKQKIKQSPIPQLPLEVAVIKSCDFFVSSNDSKNIVSEKLDEENIDSDESLKKIIDNWDLIISNINTPFIKMAFMDSDPVSMINNILLLRFKSESYMEKVSSPNNKGEVLSAFEKVLSIKPSLKFELEKIDLNVNEKKDDNIANIGDATKIF